MPVITQPYTLFTRIPLYVDERGRYFAEALWGKDLLLHFDYIADLRLCCPVLPTAAATKPLLEIPGLAPTAVTAIGLDRGWVSVVLNLLPNLLRVSRALRRSAVAHSGGAGWAFPLSYYLLLLRPFRSFRWVMVIESTFWMPTGEDRRLGRRALLHRLHLALIRACVRRADARIFTHEGYRALFLEDGGEAHVSPATWIDESAIRPAPTETDLSAATPLRLVFPARLNRDKGVRTVLEAIAALDRSKGAVTLDIIGEGGLRAECEAFAAERGAALGVRILAPVPYGAPFFELLGRYDAFLVANLTQEQPRIILDGFSQGLACIASATAGNLEVLRPGENALLFDAGDAAGLARAIETLAADRAALMRLKAAGLSAVRGLTHAEMHRKRAAFLSRRLNVSPEAPPGGSS